MTDDSAPALNTLVAFLCCKGDSEVGANLSWVNELPVHVRHSLGPAIWSEVLRRKILIPPPLREQLETQGRRNALRFLQMKAVLFKVFSEFERAGVQVMALKGAHLALDVYPVSTMRTFCDIDLLVREKDKDIASDCLRSAGFSAREWTAVLDNDEHHTVWDSPLFVLPIELHWQLLNPSARSGPGPLELVWANAVSYKLGSRTVYLMSEEDLFCYLCVHAVKHRLDQGPRVLFDLLFLLRSERKLNWSRVRQSALGWDAVYAVALLVSCLRLVFPQLDPEIQGEVEIPREIAQWTLIEMMDVEDRDQRRARGVLTFSYLPPAPESIQTIHLEEKSSLLSYFLWLKRRFGGEIFQDMLKACWKYCFTVRGRADLLRRYRLHRWFAKDCGPSEHQMLFQSQYNAIRDYFRRLEAQVLFVVASMIFRVRRDPDFHFESAGLTFLPTSRVSDRVRAQMIFDLVVAIAQSSKSGVSQESVVWVLKRMLGRRNLNFSLKFGPPVDEPIGAAFEGRTVKI